MAKYLKKKSKSAVPLPVLIPAVLILLAAFVIFVMPQLLYRLSGEDAETLPSQTDIPSQAADGETTQAAIPPVVSPLSADDGRLEIGSLFPFSGVNPDCGNQEGENIAAITLKNLSGEYLSEAAVTLTLSDGTLLRFSVAELPAGESAMAFSTENIVLSPDAVCVGAECAASYDPDAVVISDRVTASVDGIHVTLTNTSDRALSKIVIYCRSLLGEDFFGGTAYSYTITDLPAGASASLDAADCIMGMAEAVRFAVEDETR